MCSSPPFSPRVGTGSPTSSSLTSSPIVFVFYLKKEEEAAFQSLLLRPENAILCTPRIRIIAYVVSEGCFFYTNYPINILRNIGIRNTHTTHFIVLDMDMWMGSERPVEDVNRREFLPAAPFSSP